MGIYKAEIANMRKNIKENVGQKIIVKEPIGKRSKPEERVGTIDKTYDDFFLVKFDSAKSTYHYKDLFMKSVEISIQNGEEYMPVYVPDVADRKNKLHKMTPEQVEGKIMGRPEINLSNEIA